jgi:hypothetical protein
MSFAVVRIDWRHRRRDLAEASQRGELGVLQLRTAPNIN